MPFTAPITWQTSRRKLRGFVLDRASGRPVPGVVVAVRIEPDQKVYTNLGLLVSDSAGYVAFDLAPYLARFTARPVAIWVRAIGDYGASQRVETRLDTEEFGYDFLIRVDARTIRRLSNGSVQLPSVQSPDLTDWEISPHSFVTKSEARLGEGGCQVPHPNTLAERELRFARVVYVTRPEISDSADIDTYPVNPLLPVWDFEMPRDVRFGFVLEFSQRWYPIGHSTGQLLYSLALAPCESVNLAVIDWEREDRLRRQDQVTAREALFHEQRRDRVIDESVTGALRENQNGWSVMAGHSHGDSATGEADLTSIVGFPLQVGATAANMFGIGGSIANTSGTRDLTANSLQDLHDRVLQSTSVVRSLSSTVIVQATQRESNVIQTRTVTNHNHCHALTVQYFEVLRHFKVVTEYERRRRVVLIPYVVSQFDRDSALRLRMILELVLLDPKLRGAFNALARLSIGEDAYGVAAPTVTPPAASTPTGPDYASGQHSFTVNANEVKQTGLLIEPGSQVQASATGQGIKFSFDLGAGYGPAGETRIATQPFPASGKHEYALMAQIGGEFYEIGAGATFTTQYGGSLRLLFNDWKLDDNKGSAEVEVAITRPAPVPQPPAPEPSEEPEPQVEGPTEQGDLVIEQLLLNHLNANLGYYSRLVWLLQDPTSRRIMLEGALMNRPDLLFAINDTPIATSGNYVAFALDTGEDLEALRGDDDRSNPPQVGLATFPTRGVFAEAMLGHCNACETRDVTRFWKWEESPCEHAPTIEGITPGPRGQTPTIQPATLPSPVVQITQPAPAPDPVGLAAALTLLGRGDVFRDMSGLKEVQELLDGLVSGTVDLAKAQELAGDAKKAIGAGGGTDSPSARPRGPIMAEQTPEQRYDNLQVARQAAASASDMGWDDATTQEMTRGIMGGFASSPLGMLADIALGVTGPHSNPWNQDRQWTDQVPGGTATFAQEYHTWVAANYDAHNDEEMLCNWFPLRLLVEYAAGHGLRVRLRYWPGNAPTDGSGERDWDEDTILVLDSHGGKFASKDAYYKKVKSTVTAKMLAKLNTVAITRAQTRVGDLLLYNNGEDTNKYWHAEVIVGATATDLTAQSGTTPKAVPQDREEVTGGGAVPAGAYGGSPRRWAFQQFAP